MEMIFACCDCKDPVFSYFTHKNLDLNILDNSGPDCVITESNQIAKSAFGIQIKLDRKEKTAFNWFSKPSIFTKSYAFDCYCPAEEQFKAADSINAIEIICLTDFDSLHPANSNITEFFRVYENFSFYSIKTFINEKQITQFEFFEYEQLIFNLLLIDPPAFKTQKFKINISFSDGRILSSETRTIELI